MFTQCPQCAAAFRITAEVLQQARGQVRCGSCDSAFNALDHLFEEPPATAVGDDPAPEGNGDRDQALLNTLNRLAGPDEVRIEDTGVEWLVVDDDDVPPEGAASGDADATGAIKWILKDTDNDSSPGVPSVSDPLTPDFDPETADTAEQPIIDDAAHAPPEEARYDDNTPLPDDFEDQHNYVPQTHTPMRRSTDVMPADNDDGQVELELSEPDDWMDLLDEFATGSGNTVPDEAEALIEPPVLPQTTDVPPPGIDLPLDVEEELAAIHGELSNLSDATAADLPLPISDDDLDITLDGEPDAEIENAAAEGDEVEAEVSIVATQLDDLLEAMGSGRFKSPAATDEAQDNDPLEESPEDSPEGSSDSPPADAEPLTLASDDVPLALDAGSDAAEEPVDETGSEDPPGAEMVEGSDAVAVDEDAHEDEDGASDAALAAGDASGDTVDEEDTADDVEYDESSGEFARAIADAEGEILAAARADAAPDDNDDNGEQDFSAGTGLNDEKEQAAADADADNKPGADEPGDPDADLKDDIAAMTGSMQIDASLLRAMKDGSLDPSMVDEDGSPIVETIVMEGDFVRGALMGADEDDSFASASKKPSRDLPDPGSLIDTYISNRDAAKKSGLFSGKRAIVGATMLLVLLIGQFLHMSRESLATYGLFNQTLGPVYRMFGEPVTPTWDIKGWQFEATSGSTNETDSLLTVSSRISNRSDKALPYPLVHISLTDRYEEIMGSKVLEPNEYLAGSADPSRPVAAGDSFTAIITIASPAEEATGFKLNVCYRVVPGRVRCAIEDFKAP